MALRGPNLEEFPVISLHIRDPPPETSSPQTPPTAIESAEAETPPMHPEVVREIAAIPRGFSVGAF